MSWCQVLNFPESVYSFTYFGIFWFGDMMILPDVYTFTSLGIFAKDCSNEDPFKLMEVYLSTGTSWDEKRYELTTTPGPRNVIFMNTEENGLLNWHDLEGGTPIKVHQNYIGYVYVSYSDIIIYNNYNIEYVLYI